MKQRKNANILFLPRVKEDDFKTIEDLFESKLQDQFADECTEPLLSVLDKIPTRFYNKNSWIKSTNLKCWNCSRKFNTIPLFIPMCMLTDSDGNEYFEVKGNFCKINCAYVYSLHIFSDNDAIDAHARLLLLHLVIYGTRILKIPISPAKHEMEDYGGDWTSDEYEKEIEKRNNDQNLTKYKLEHFKINSNVSDI